MSAGAPPLPPLGLVVLAGDHARAHTALMMAAAAAALDRRVTVFVTMDALPLLLAGEGWRTLRDADRDDLLRRRGVAGMEELLAACAATGVAFMACEAGLKARGIEAGALRGDLAIEIAGLVTFLAAAGGGQIVAF